MKKDARHKRVEELIGVVGLKERMDHKPGELSGGEQQRIALAAALANDPPLILADEPTGELDTENAMIVVNYLAKVNKELGKTIIMVTHDPRVARAASRLLRIQDGVLATDVAPSEEAAPTQTNYTDMLKARLTSIDSQLVGARRGVQEGRHHERPVRREADEPQEDEGRSRRGAPPPRRRPLTLIIFCLREEAGHQLPRLRVAEDNTTTANGAWFNFRVRNGFGWFPRPMAGNPNQWLWVSILNLLVPPSRNFTEIPPGRHETRHCTQDAPVTSPIRPKNMTK